jgi:hypothetical protein
MARRLLGHDNMTGITTYHDFDETTGTTYIHEVQDVKGILDFTKRLANDSEYKRKGIKSDWYHFATVPLTVLNEIRIKYGFDWNKKDDLNHIERIIKTEYKKLLTVDKI